MAVPAEEVENQEGRGRAREDARRQLLQEVWGRERLAAGAVDGPEQLVAQRVHEHHGTLKGGSHRVVKLLLKTTQSEC